MQEPNINLLYGKPLHTLVTTALISLELKKSSNDILLKTIVAEIIENKPDLAPLLTETVERLKLRYRVHNCVKKMAEVNFVEIELKEVKEINYTYVVIKPKLL